MSKKKVPGRWFGHMQWRQIIALVKSDRIVTEGAARTRSGFK